MKKLIYYFGLLFCFQMVNANAEKAEVFFKEANLLYQKGEFQAAADLYQQIEILNLESPELYYNLGNCFYKMNQLPQAIYNYEKALKRKPADEKIRNNLEVAYSKTIDAIPQNEVSKPTLYIKSFLIAGGNLFLYISCITSLLLLLLIIIYKKHKKVSLVKPLKIAIVVFIVFFVLSFFYHQEKNELVGVVFSTQTNLITLDKKQTVRKIHEGTKVIIEDTEGSFLKVHLTDFSKGLVKKEAIKRVD